ncbi:MAG TPA: helix-turn-helix transcriptional regulator [Trebonia sp.]
MVTYEARKAAPAEQRRMELGGFLRACRARLTPEDFGMPAGARRRTPGLRREEVAQLAGVGVTWYTWLEQGREINVSTQVLDAVARTLRLGQTERNHLYVLAEAVPVLADTSRCALSAEIKEIVRSLDPLPAAVTNARFDQLLRNDAYTDLFRDWHSDPCVQKNSLWCCLNEATARDKFPQYEAETRYMVARLRCAYAQHIGDPDWDEDIRRLAKLNSEFAGLWALHEVAEPETRTRTYIDRAAGPLTFTLSELSIPAAPDARLLVYTPADDKTRQGLPLTRARAGTSS